jgi:hypothetical protein
VAKCLPAQVRNTFCTHGGDSARLRVTTGGCIRLDYEDGKLVAVTLEPEGEEA